MTLTISAKQNASDAASRRRELADELIDELMSTPREKMNAYRAWHRGALSLVHLNVLSVLEAEGPISMGRLAEALDVSVASATGIVSRMTARGVVERRHDAADRRVVLVHLTEAGSKVNQSLDQNHRERLGELLEQLSAAEMAGFLLGLRAMHAARARMLAAAGNAAVAAAEAPVPGTTEAAR
ncbi:MAG TPA: MarR family transcriptional regulator [Candidatus Limnocylindrales bacterium]